MLQRGCRGILKLSGVQLTVHGSLSTLRPLLVVSNHLSYMDIIMLASCCHMRFTPKSEIARWPFIGFLCKIADCVFVDRRASKVKETSALMHEALNKDDVISIFPEATTGNGVHMLPFKSSFFNLADEDYTGRKLHIQPVALTYTHVKSLPIDHRLWPQIAWVGDDELVPHVWNFFNITPVKAELHFLEPVTMDSYKDRKDLAANCQKLIEQKIDLIRTKSYISGPQSASTTFSLLKGKSK